MVSQQIIEIIIKAENQVNQAAKQANDALSKFGDTAQKANQKTSQATQMTKQQLDNLSSKIKSVSSSSESVASKGAKQFQRYNKSVQDGITKFNMLDKETQEWLNRLSNSNKPKIFYELNSKAQEAVAKFNALDAQTKTWSGSLEYAKTKMDLLGNNTNTLRGKIQTTGMAIQTYLGTKWDGIKTKVSSVAQSIKGKIGSAIASVKTKLGGLNGGFNKVSSGAKSAGGSLGFLSGAASMAAGMIGFELFNSFVQSGRAAINARSQLDYFGGRLQKMSGQSKLTAQGFNKFKTELGDLQKEFRKIDMTAVGATAEELAVKMQLPADKLGDLTRMTAVMSSTFVKEGRTQEDAVLAVSDALDGQFQKLKEIGITKEDLVATGKWNGDLKDQKGLIDALNESMENMGYVQTAKDITSLDDAFNVLSVSGGNLLASVLIPLTPVIVEIVETFVNFADTISSAWAGLPDWGKLAIGFGALAVALGLLAPALTATNIASIPLIGTLYGLATAEIAVSWPILAIVAAIGLLVVAIFEIGKAFGWWTDVGSMIDAITSNIGRLWNAFINHPDVQATIKGIQDAWNGLNEFLKPVVDWLHGIWDMMFPPSAKGKVDGTRIIIDAIGKAFQAVTLPIRTVIGVLQALYNFALPIGQGIWNALKPIVCILLGCSPGIVPALQKVQEIFLVVWSWISSFIIGIVSNVVDGIKPVLHVLSAIGNFLLSAFQYAWQTIIMVFNIVMSHVNVLINIFSRLLSGQLSLSSALGMIWNVIKSLFISVLGIIISRVGIFARSLISKALEAGKGFVNNILNFIKNLPGNIGTILLNIVSRIVSAGASWISAGIGVASSMVNGVINHVSQLPGKVYTEFTNIGSRIMSAGSDLVNKAKDIGKNIVDGLLGAMGIHSPGIIQNKVVTEFKDTLGGVEEQMKPAGELAKTFGETMVDQFGTLQFDTNSLYTDLDMPKMNMDIGMDTSSVNSTNNMVATSYDSLANATGSSLQSMIDKDKNAYNLIRNNDATQLSAITANLQNKMNTMSNKVKTSMDTMLNKNKTGLNSARNTTQTQLTNITNATVKANQKMIESWKIMKTGIVDAANKIKTDSTNHFNKLEGTIGGFYRKLQNPGGFGAGPGTGRVSTVKRTGANGFKRIANVMRQYSMPSYISLGEIRRNPFISTDNIGEYITPNKNNLYSVNDLLKSGNIRIPVGLTDPKNKGAGKWTDGVGKHVQKIKDTSKNWGMKGPKIIGKYQTSKGFKVSDFINGTPQIDFATFKQMAEDVFGQTHYDFYYDNDKHGNWMGALRAGYLNCYHGAQALIAFANACGLSGNLVHGHWNKFGHFWANIAGHKMDVTGWQQQRNWTPAASHAGPAPKSWSLEDLFDELKSALTGDENQVVVENNSGQVSLDGEFKIIHEFLNLPENISEAEIVRLIEESTSSDSWIRKLVENVVFQKLDLKQKSRIEARTNRSRGAI